jgi:hypothetical protein
VTRQRRAERRRLRPTKRSLVRREHDAYDFILTQWFLHEAGLLSPDRVLALNTSAPGWFEYHSFETNGGHPFVCDNPELRSAFTANWNAHGFSERYMTFDQIRAKAEREV